MNEEVTNKILSVSAHKPQQFSDESFSAHNEPAGSPGFSRSEPPEGGTPYTPPRFMAPIRVNSFDISPRKTVAR